MKKISEAVQYGLERQNTGNLQTMWIEEPGLCDLACSYCYARGGEPLKKHLLLKWSEYENILIQAKRMGVDSIGIPGAGEPFFSTNHDLTMRILKKCADLSIYVTLFTTGKYITPALASELLEFPVEIMLKGNSLDPDKQDLFVSSPKKVIHGYGEQRNKTIEILMEKGFNDEASCLKKFGRKSRIGLVTSIMTNRETLSNIDELPDIIRFCRRRNIIFDCDTVLREGRGAKCNLCADDAEVKAVLLLLQKIDKEEFENIWKISQSYVGTTCDRYMHHMYINQYGEIRPCIGATRVNLGNIRATSFAQTWDSFEMKIIRSHNYHGKCGECANFETGECSSCLGRRTENLDNQSLKEKGCVQTIGCWNFRKKE